MFSPLVGRHYEAAFL